MRVRPSSVKRQVQVEKSYAEFPARTPAEYLGSQTSPILPGKMTRRLATDSPQAQKA